ncbi:MAG: signal protein PDZ [Bacteroidetes bacterium]|nr:MAG: signal protein PDZ [Bacteroidota bacterium]
MCNLLAALLVFYATTARAEIKTPPSRLLSVIPFRVLSGGIIVIKSKVGDFPDSLNFIFDTGSDGISLDSTTCERLHISTQLSDRKIRSISGISLVRFVPNTVLRMPDLNIDSLNFYVNDFSILTSVYGENIDGIIGYSFFSKFIVKIDYDSLKIYVYSRGSIKYPKGGYLTHPFIVNLPVESAKVKENADITARFYFDTGAGLCLLLSNDFISDSALFNIKKKKPVETLALGVGGKKSLRQTTVKDFKFGPFHFRNVPAYIFDDEYNITSYPSLAGLIGNDLLDRFNVILNYGRREIYMTPNSHYRDLFDYSYTGLGIYWIGGDVRVSDVIKDSPAEKAGFKTDDIIIGVANNFSGNIQDYKNLLQRTGEKIKVVVRRENKLLEFKLKVNSIF